MALIPKGSRAAAVVGSYSNVNTRQTSFGLEVNLSRLANYPAEVRERCRDVIQKATTDIQGETQLIIKQKDLIKTGNLLNSITGYSTLDGMTGYVDVGAYYGIYLEFGTIKMSARPFLGPAVDKIGPGFIAAIRQVMREAAK